MQCWEQGTVSLDHRGLTPVVFSAHDTLPVDGSVEQSFSDGCNKKQRLGIMEPNRGLDWRPS